MNPLISVVMAVYNCEKYLSTAITSILEQSCRDFEFLIVDDCSTDNSIQLIDQFKDNRIKVLHNDKNLGLTRSLNLALRQAKGEFIARMDADDMSLPERFSGQVEFLQKNPKIGVIGTAAILIDENGNQGKTIHFSMDHEKLCWDMAFFDNPFVHSSIMFRNEIARLVNYYNEDMRVSQDYDLWSRLSCITEVGNLNQEWLLFRKHHSSISGKNFQEQMINSLKIGKNHITRKYGFQLPENILYDACLSIWNPHQATPDQIKNLLQYIQIIGSKVVNDHSIPMDIRLYALNDALMRQYDFMDRYPSIIKKSPIIRWKSGLDRQVIFIYSQKGYNLPLWKKIIRKIRNSIFSFSFLRKKD